VKEKEIRIMPQWQTFEANRTALKTFKDFCSTTGFVDLPEPADKLVFVGKSWLE